MALSLDAVKNSPATPPPAPLAMPAQDFNQDPDTRFSLRSLRTVLSQIVTFGGCIGLTAYAAYQMYLIISVVDATTILQWLWLGLFVITFAWIALAATAAVSGVLFGWRRQRADHTKPPEGRTALLMPVYNEDPAATCAALYAMARTLSYQGATRCFEIFIISDTNDPALWVQETAAVSLLREQLADIMPVWYRRRHDNTGKKAGNVQNFLTNWGDRYDYMIVLDADSLISADALCGLVREMDASPRCGILQTFPRLYAGNTLFARLQQFAGSLYGPVVAKGIATWQGNDGNFWGHNAIIRTRTFASSAGLPRMPGPRPFGGEILSHDFVEAALVRRAGWNVEMMPSLPGSWEESPPTLLDSAKRDRRWAQGNIQHLGVIPAKGLRWPNRAHMLIGVMSYLASPLWLAMVTTGLVMASIWSAEQFDYFTEEFQLFPRWPVFDSERMIFLFIFTICILLLPKTIGYLQGLFSRTARKGSGPLRLSLGVIVELFFSILYAPIFMMIHSQQLWEIFRGKDSGWSTQQRDSQGVNWRELFARHWFHTVFGIAMTGLLLWLDTLLFYWMLPILLGLVFSIPLSALSGSKQAGRILRSSGILGIPEEETPPPEMMERKMFIDDFSDSIHSLSFHCLFNEPEQQRRHLLLSGQRPKPKRGHPDIEPQMAYLKLQDAHTCEEALSWLTPGEMMAVLSDKAMLTLLAKLPTENSTAPSQPI